MTPRAGHTATLLPNGKVLIAGGFQQAFPNLILSSAELYHRRVLVAALLFSLSGDEQGQGAIWHALPEQIASADMPAVAGEALSIYTISLLEAAWFLRRWPSGGRFGVILYFGDAPGYPGKQVNFRVPRGVAEGLAVPVRLTYIGRPSNAVTIGVR